MSIKNDYQKKIEAQLHQWEAEINLLKAKAQNTEADAKINYQKNLEELKLKKGVAIKRLQEIKTSGAEAFEDLKEGAYKASAELKHGIDSALSHLK